MGDPYRKLSHGQKRIIGQRTILIAGVSVLGEPISVFDGSIDVDFDKSKEGPIYQGWFPFMNWGRCSKSIQS